MTKYIVLGLLALTTILCAVIEGLIELPPRSIQALGVLCIISTVTLIGWSLSIKTDDLGRD